MFSEQIHSMLSFILILFSCYFLEAQPTENEDPTANYKFRTGEHLDFKLSYGWFTVGKASLDIDDNFHSYKNCLLYTSPSPRDRQKSRMPSSA